MSDQTKAVQELREALIPRNFTFERAGEASEAVITLLESAQHDLQKASEWEQACIQKNHDYADALLKLETAQRERDDLNGSMSARILGLQKELERRDTQVNQVLHLLQGGSNLTREQVIESGLGEGVLIEQRHHEYMRTKAENECGALAAKVERLADMLVTCAQTRETIRLEKHTFAKQIDFLAAKCAKLESERAKWEEGCRVNADNAKDALRLADNQRLEIISLRSKCGQPLLDELDQLRKALDRIQSYPIYSEPIGGALEMQDIAYKALNPEAK